MDIPPPTIINLPPLSDDSVVAIYRCLAALIDAFESRYAIQLWRHYDNQPQHNRPAKFSGEPF